MKMNLGDEAVWEELEGNNINTVHIKLKNKWFFFSKKECETYIGHQVWSRVSDEGSIAAKSAQDAIIPLWCFQMNCSADGHGLEAS